MPIEVAPAQTAAAGAAATELAAVLRTAMDRLHAAGPAINGSAVGSAWSALWTTLRRAVLDVAVAGEDLAATSRAAVIAVTETETGLVPDAH